MIPNKTILINSVGIVYHRREAPYLIKPPEMHGGAMMICSAYHALMIYQAGGLDKKRTAEAVLFW